MRMPASRSPHLVRRSHGSLVPRHNVDSGWGRHPCLSEVQIVSALLTDRNVGATPKTRCDKAPAAIVMFLAVILVCTAPGWCDEAIPAGQRGPLSPEEALRA